jgi:hypothetical protein
MEAAGMSSSSSPNHDDVITPVPHKTREILIGS